MKSFSILFSILLTIPLFSNPFKVDLTQSCDSNNCKPRVWYITDRFENNFLSLDTAPENWKAVDKFPIWMNKYFEKEGSIATYSMLTFFDLPDNVILNRQAGIKFGEIGEVFEIYINGNLIAQEGTANDTEVLYHRTVRGKIYELDKTFLKQKNNTLLVKISGHPKYDHTGFYLVKGYEVGQFEDLQYAEQDRITLVLIGIYLTIGTYHLFLYTKRRKDLYNLFYALYTIGLGIYVYTRTSAIFEHSWDTVFIQRVELCVLYPVIFFNFALQEELFFNRVRKITLYYGYFLFAWSAITILIPMFIAEYLLRVWQISFITLGISIAVNIIYTSVKRKIPNAKRLMFGMIFIMCSAIFDVIDSLVLNTGLAFSKYAFFIYVFGFATILANNFIQVHNEIENLNNTLERKVKERTLELSTSLEKVNELKKQQDGDYYLTSLLLNPLGVNHAIKKGIDVEFIIQQKKKFTFKGNDSELGGDLCRTETIYLKNRQFTVFFNADAMGKSMQGAGGAIVVGAVFDSIIERTKLSRVVQNSYPERWLKNSFVELHKVFESFDCTMLVSIVVGLVDNASGLIYYINAEHPFPVLYRDGKASFVGDDFIYRKLGTPVNESAYISIDTFQMNYGDLFISGSDGRDDIIVQTQLGEKVLNSDEKLFLKVVEEAEGNLQKIIKRLKKDGDLTDDISLLKISLSENPYPFDMSRLEEIINQSSTLEPEDNNKDLPVKELHIRNLKKKFLTYFKNNKMEEAIISGKEYLDWIPADDTMIFKVSECLKLVGRLQEAIELGERLRLRRKQNIDNLINLAECYIKLNQSDRASLLLKDVFSIDPESRIAKDLMTQLNA